MASQSDRVKTSEDVRGVLPVGEVMMSRDPVARSLTGRVDILLSPQQTCPKVEMISEQML